MPRVKKTSEDVVEVKSVPSVRRTRQSSVVPNSPVRRSARNKSVIDSSPESLNSVSSVNENNASKRPARKKAPTPDPESSQASMNLRKRSVKSESETKTVPAARVTRRTRATSVVEDTTATANQKSSTGTSVKGRRRRLLTAPSETSFIEEETNDFETSEKMSDKQNSSHESSDRIDDDNPQESNTSKEEEIETSPTVPTESSSNEESVIIIDEFSGEKSVMKKKEKNTSVEKKLMIRLFSNKINYSDNDSIGQLPQHADHELKLKKERHSNQYNPQISIIRSKEVAEKERSGEIVQVDEEKSTEVIKEKTPRKSSEKRFSLKNSSREENEGDINGGKSPEEEVISETIDTNGIKETLDKKTTPNKKNSPTKRETPTNDKTPAEIKTHEKTPTGKKTPNKSKSPKNNRTPRKRSSSDFSVDEDGDSIDETKEAGSFLEEPMEVDTTEHDLYNGSDHQETSIVDKETIDVPERMNCNFRPRKSMVDFASEKLSVSKDRYSLGSRNPESVSFNTEISDNPEKKNRESNQNINSESKTFTNDSPSVQALHKMSSPAKKMSSSLEKMPSTSEQGNSCSSNSSSQFHLLVSPENDELSKSREKFSTSPSKSSEKKNRKRKREISDSDQSEHQLSLLEYEEECSANKSIDKSNASLTDENSDKDKDISKNRRSVDKRRSKDLKEEKPEESIEKEKTPKRDKNESLLMSESLEQVESPNFKVETPHTEDEEEPINKSHLRRSKSKSSEENGMTSNLEVMEISKYRKSLDIKRSMSRSFEKEVDVREEQEATSLEKSSKNDSIESESEEEVSTATLNEKSNKPVIRNIEILQENDSDKFSFISTLKTDSEEKEISEKTPEKLNKSQTNKNKYGETEEGEGSEKSEASEESDCSEGSLEMETVKRARKSKTRSLTPMKSIINKLENSESSGRKSKLGKKIEEEDSEIAGSKIPAFMLSQTSSEDESEGDEEVSIGEESKSMDSDIAKEYNLDGKSISHYSDDDVPADECRASESEHSDSEDEGSDLADFVVDDDEEQEVEVEEDSDDSVFEKKSLKSPKETKTKRIIKKFEEETEEDDEKTEDEKEEKEQTPSKGSGESQDSPTNSTNSNQERKCEERLEQIKKHERLIEQQEQQIKKQEKQVEEMEVEIQEHESQIEEEENKLSLEKEQSSKKLFNLCSEESDSSTSDNLNKFEKYIIDSDIKIKENMQKIKPKTKERKEEMKAVEPAKSKKQKKKKKPKLEETEIEEKPLKEKKAREEYPELAKWFAKEETKKKQKSKRELKATGCKIPVASSTRYEINESEEEPESISFSDARNEALETMKKTALSIKAAKEAKKNKRKSQVEKAKIEINSRNIKRLPNEIIEELEDVPRPKKRQKLSKKEDFNLPSLSMHNLPYSSNSSKGKSLISASACGSTTDFQVVNLEKEKKVKPNALALQWLKQRMLAKNIRQPISVYLSYQQKRRAAGKDHF